MSGPALPMGWATTTIADIVEPITKTDPTKWTTPADLIYYDIGGIDNHRHRVHAHQVVPSNRAPSRARQIVQPGDVLFSTVRTYLENIAVVPRPPIEETRTLASTGFCVLRAGEGLDPRFLYYRVLATDLLSAMGALQQGTSYPAIHDDDLKGFSIALPPSAEQVRIADEVERRLSHVTAAEQTIERAIHRIERASVSVLNAAARGDLLTTCAGESLALRLEESQVPFEPVPGKHGWVRVRIGAIANVGSGATPKRGVAKYWQDGDIPWVTSGQLLNSRVTEPAEYITQAALDETSVKLWPAGTLLVAMYGEGRTRGHCAELTLDATCNQACAAISLKPGFEDLQAFLHLVLDARYEENRSLSSGGVQENLNLGLIKNIEVGIPPDECRDALVSEARRRISLLGAARDTIARQLARCAAARSSILTAAFTGQLVPQDPSDEPATVLLERIKEQRESAEPTKKPSRRPRAKKETTP